MRNQSLKNSVHIESDPVKERRGHRNRWQTAFIALDTHKCKACWKCIDACPHKVFGKINIIVHKHAVMIGGDKCTGCGRCIKSCDNSAIYRLEKRGDLND